MKVNDVFIFYNELDLLEIRLNILNDSVDFFFIIESTKTFTGNPKVLYYEENKERFKKFHHKIKHYIVDDCPDSFEEVVNRLSTETDELNKKILEDCLSTNQIPKDNSQVQWLREFYQKESMKKALANSGISDEDICYISDLDEIWNPETKKFPSDGEIYKFNQIVYSMFLNLRSSESWSGTYCGKYSHIKNSTLNHLDNPGVTNCMFVDDGGWHFTFQGGIDMILNKIENYGHQEMNNQWIKSNIPGKFQGGTDILNRNYQYHIDDKELPEFLKINREKYLRYFK